MALTLLQASQVNSGTVKEATLIEQFPRSSEILRVLPFRTISGNALQYTMEDSLPGVAFRGINEGFPESTGIFNPFTERLAISGGDLDVDKFIIDTQGTEQRDIQERMKVKALALNWTKWFFDGDSRVDPRQFDGINARIVGSQLLTAGANGGALKTDMLDEAIDLVDEPTHIIMHPTIRRNLNKAIRSFANVNITKDEFGRRITTYNDLPILEIGTDDTGADILAFDETMGTDPQTTSIYVVSIGEGKLQGLQGYASGVAGISVRDIGELQTKPTVRTRMEWYSGIMIKHGRAAARIRGVNKDPVSTV